MDAETLNAETPLNYHTVLVNYLETMIGRKFHWGDTHCTALVFGMLDSVYGTRYSLWHRKTHEVFSKEKALELSEKEETLKVFTDIGFMEIDLYSIKAGDIIYAKNNGYECCHIFTGTNFVSSNMNGAVENILYHDMLYALRDTQYKVFTIMNQ